LSKLTNYLLNLGKLANYVLGE